MIKIVAIHKLCEVALETLFNAISHNFTKTNKLMIGCRYNAITIIRHSLDGVAHHEQYNNCIITHIYQGKYADSPVTLFNFKTNNGDLIMGCTLFDSILN